MKMFISKLLFGAQFFSFLAILLLPGCEYDPEGKYEVEVKEITEVPELLINLNFATDTLYVPTNYMVKVEYQSGDPFVRYASFFLNNKQLAVSEVSGYFYITFNSSVYQTHTPYTLNFSFFRSSGSGSLADKLQQEGFLYSRKYILYFVNENEMAPRILRAVNENGKLKVCWEKYMGFGFLRYFIRPIESENIAVIEDQNVTSCIYNSYIGFGTTLELLTETEDNIFHSGYYTVAPELPVLKAQLTDDSAIKFTWGKSRYPQNITGYKVYEYLWYYDKKNEIASISEPSDTTFFYTNAKFGVSARYFLEIIPKTKPQFTYDYASVTENMLIGTPIPYILTRAATRGSFSYVSSTSDNLLSRYDTESHSIVETLPLASYSRYCSHDGKLLLSSNPSAISLIDADNWEIMASYTVDLFPDENMLPYRFMTGNNGIGVLVFPDGLCFYDFINKATLKKFTISGTSLDNFMDVSPDGTYFIIQYHNADFSGHIASLYHFTGTDVELSWQDATEFVDLDALDNTLVYFKNNQVIHVSLDDLSIISDLTLPAGSVHDIDWYRREILFLNQAKDKFSIFGLDDGALRKEIATYAFGDYYYHTVYLINKTLYLYDRMLKLTY